MIYPGGGALRLDDPLADRVADEARRLVDPELAHQPGAMELRRLDADAQDLRDLLRRLALRDQLEDLLLARGQRLLGSAPPAQRGLDDRAGDPRAQVGVPAHDLVERAHEVGGALALEHVALDAGLE